jgi:putative MATE family efflux protein
LEVRQDLTSFKNIVAVTLPIIIGGLSLNIVGITDTIFLSWLGEVELGAVGNANIFYFIFAFVGMGFTTGVQIILGRRNGQGLLREIGRNFDQGIYFILFYSSLAVVSILLASAFLIPLLVSSNEVLAGIQEFLRMRSWGIFFTLLNMGFISFYVGIAKTRVIAVLMPIASGLNIILDYGFIFGNLGLPQLGISGAAMASNISEGVGTLLLLVYTIRNVDLKKYDLFRFRAPNLSLLKHQLNLSSPLMLQNSLTLMAWFTFFSLIESLGERELAISHIVRSLYMLITFPLFSLGDATNTLVSNLIGRGEDESVFKLLKRVIVIGFGFNILVLIVSLTFSDEIIGVFANDPALIEAAKPTFYIVNAVLFLFCAGILSFRALSGTGLTRTSLGVEGMSVLIYLSYAYFVSKELKMGLEMTWTSEFIYFSFLLVGSLYFLRKRAWKQVDV